MIFAMSSTKCVGGVHGSHLKNKYTPINVSELLGETSRFQHRCKYWGCQRENLGGSPDSCFGYLDDEIARRTDIGSRHGSVEVCETTSMEEISFNSEDDAKASGPLEKQLPPGQQAALLNSPHFASQGQSHKQKR